MSVCTALRASIPKEPIFCLSSWYPTTPLFIRLDFYFLSFTYQFWNLTIPISKFSSNLINNFKEIIEIRWVDERCGIYSLSFALLIKDNKTTKFHKYTPAKGANLFIHFRLVCMIAGYGALTFLVNHYNILIRHTFLIFYICNYNFFY